MGAMGGNWSRRRKPLDLERELRESRPEPRDDFVRSLAERVRPDRRVPLAPLRIGLAAALTAALLVALAAFGGFSYGRSGANQGVKAAERGNGSSSSELQNA